FSVVTEAELCRIGRHKSVNSRLARDGEASPRRTEHWGTMPYIVLAEKDREIDRRELTGPIVLGRSPECDISVRDILLSRRLCALEPFGSYWVIADLGSKNGTWLKGHRISRHVLAEGEVLRMGKIQLCFRAGAFIPAPPSEAKPAGARAADPKE